MRGLLNLELLGQLGLVNLPLPKMLGKLNQLNILELAMHMHLAIKFEGPLLFYGFSWAASGETPYYTRRYGIGMDARRDGAY